MSNVDFDNIPKDRQPRSGDKGKKIYNKQHDAKQFTIKRFQQRVYSTGEVTTIEAYDKNQRRYTFKPSECKLVEPRKE